LPNTEKMGDQWLSSIKLYYSKKMWNFVFNYNKNDLHHQKAYKTPHIRLLNSFLILQIVKIGSSRLLKTRFWQRITRKQFEI
jgi:hypothetical protein